MESTSLHNAALPQNWKENANTKFKNHHFRKKKAERNKNLFRDDKVA